MTKFWEYVGYLGILVFLFYGLVLGLALASISYALWVYEWVEEQFDEEK